MNVCSFEWVGCLILLSAFFFWLPGITVRQVLLACCNVGFLLTLTTDAMAIVALVVFLITGFLAVKILQIRPRRYVLAGYIVLLSAAFLFLKQYAFVKILLPASLFQRVIAVAGLSYMLFRQIHMVVDAYQGQLKNVTLWNYINYQINLFGLVAGPIQRYPDFCDYWMDLKPRLNPKNAILQAYLRVFVGVLKVALIAGFCLTEYEKWSSRIINPDTFGSDSHWITIIKLLGLFYLYPAFIYFNFSGYCDIVIGGAALFGIKMPENFNQPYLSRNMIDFWTRFHQTLGLWIRDYLFTPMYKGVASHWPSRAASLAFLCYLAAFFIAGLWHGSTWNFVIYGLLNGVGVAAAKLWEMYLIKRVGRKGLRQYLESRPIRVLAIIATVNFACLTIVFFPANLGRTILVIKRGAALIF